MIKPILEGHGEVPALPILLRRIAGERFGIWNPPLLPPGHYPAGQLLRCENDVWVPGPGLIKAAGHARNEDATALLVLLDADDFCVKSTSETVSPALAVTTGFDTARIVFAVREYEAWLLASAETLQDRTLVYPNDPEQPRDAKGALERHLGLPFPYNARTEQPAFSARINLSLCHKQSRSFRKLTKDFKELLAACGMNPVESEM
jgi:Domain of unknown function (DUF4276)